MKKKLTPEYLQNNTEFELLAEVSHQELKEFVVAQVAHGKHIIKLYSFYQLAMFLLFLFVLARSIVFGFKSHPEMLVSIGLASVFSVTVLIIIHELLHALAYLVTGARKISFGAIPQKFIFYALADRQVVSPNAFRVVALAPFVIVKILCLAGIVIYFNEQLMYFFITIMCLHSLFCAGDIAMLSFYRIHKGKEIYNFDDKTKGKTYFYYRKSRS